MSAALGLFRLQQIDSRVDKLEEDLKRIKTELENNAAVAAAEREFAEAEAVYAQAEGQRLAAEQSARSQRNKIQQAESTLYSGGVQNPKELQDLEADVASLRKHLAFLEDSELKWMEQLETVGEGRQRARERLDQAVGSASADRARLEGQESDLTKTKERLLEERGAARSALPPELLLSYEHLRASRRGIAVAEISDGACGACGTSLTAALQQSARHASELVHCPSCGRILFGG